MIEGALKADGRIAAKNAVKIRAALRELADYKKLYLQYQETMPESSGNLARDRTRARAWAIMNVTQFRTEALASSLWRMWAEAYVLGTVAATEWLRITRELNKAEGDVTVDWDNWKPGDRAATLMLQRPKAFQQILDSTNVTIRGLTQTSITDIGNSLAEAIELGLDASSAALLIGRNVASPARALTIAITEQNRVISAATMERYKEAGLEKQEWAVSDPCAICAKNDGAVVPIGTSFPSGDIQPPAHPHCRCVLLPVIPGMEEDDGVGGTTTTPTTDADGAIQEEPFAPGVLPQGEWQPVTENRWVERQESIRLQRGLGPATENHLRIIRDQVKDAQAIYERGPNIVVLDKQVKTVTDEAMKQFMKNFDISYERLPEWRRINPDGSARGYSLIINNKNASGSALAYTYIGHDAIWFSPKDVISSLNPPKDWEGWFMPAANKVSENLYTIMHELGHTTDSYVNDNKRGYVRKLLTRRYKELFSRYSRKNTKETYAEVFAQWGLGEKNALTEAYAKAFGWDLSAAEYYEKFNEFERWKPSMMPTGSLN
jgi:SPP1 gp7 family putative phage head morphogenesis protein